MRQKAERMRWNLEVRDTFMKELAKLERTHPQSPDYSVQLVDIFAGTHLDGCLDFCQLHFAVQDFQ